MDTYEYMDILQYIDKSLNSKLVTQLLPSFCLAVRLLSIENHLDRFCHGSMIHMAGIILFPVELLGCIIKVAFYIFS